MARQISFTEEHWGKTDQFMEMIDWLRKKRRRLMTNRKTRLFICALCRRACEQWPDEQIEVAVESAEHFADRAIGGRTLQSIRDVVEKSTFGNFIAGYAAQIAFLAASQDLTLREVKQASSLCCNLVLECPPGEDHATIAQELEIENQAQCVLLRDIFGNPFRPVAVDPSWLTPDVTALAQSIYDNRRFEDMPILADALEEAGCTNEDILQHCRSGGEHVRGCWVVDLLLGME